MVEINQLIYKYFIFSGCDFNFQPLSKKKMGLLTQPDDSPTRIAGLSGNAESYLLNTMCLVIVLIVAIFLIVYAAVKDGMVGIAAGAFLLLATFIAALIGVSIIKDRRG